MTRESYLDYTVLSNSNLPMDPNNQNPQNPTPTDPGTQPVNTPVDNVAQVAESFVPESTSPAVSPPVMPAMPQPAPTDTSVVALPEQPAPTEPATSMFNPTPDMSQVPSFENSSIPEPGMPAMPNDVTASSIPPADNPPASDILGMPPSPAPSETMPSPIPNMPESSPTTKPTESMPTDLSHLIVNTPNNPVDSSVTSPQVATVPQNGNNGASVVTSGESSGLPKILLIIGAVIIFLVVTGASAYFILGVGQNNADQTTSLPIEQQQLTTPQQLLPSPVPTIATDSAATLGNLGGNSATGSSDTNAPTGSGTRAIDLLKK